METPQDWVDFGSKIGRQQAFAVIANRCTASQALALKQMKESRQYENLGLTFEQFCLRVCRPQPFPGRPHHRSTR